MHGGLRLQLSEEGADAERLDALTRLLRGELQQLDVGDVTALRSGEPPPGARGVDPVALGGLLVALSDSAALRAVISAVRAWLARGGRTHRTVKLEADGDALELSDVAAADQDRRIGSFISRHAAGETEP
jgi:hypothetical protein